jgi:hypothetical protein
MAKRQFKTYLEQTIALHEEAIINGQNVVWVGGHPFVYFSQRYLRRGHRKFVAALEAA